MRILITGICGFVGNALAHALLESGEGLEIVGIDNFVRPGSELNREPLRKRGVRLIHGDVRAASDVDQLPAIDWIIDAAANPSVLAGVDGLTSSRQLVEHNLYGTVNLLELAKLHRAGCILLSTSRVYSVAALSALAVEEADDAFLPRTDGSQAAGVSEHGIAESFSTSPPLSLYGSTKLSSELLALEYGEAFDFPVWIDRCGVLAGAGQFGRADQGIFAYWVNAYLQRRPLTYIGFGGRGLQTRDALHPRDLVPLLRKQMANSGSSQPRVVNVGGGATNARSLAQLSAWCAEQFGEHTVGADLSPRPFDLPWLVMDSRLASTTWDWRPTISIEEIWGEIAVHAREHPEWLDISAPL